MTAPTTFTSRLKQALGQLRWAVSRMHRSHGHGPSAFMPLSTKQVYEHIAAAEQIEREGADARGTLRTPAQALAEFKRTGQSIRGWALAHDLPVTVVYEILRGSTRRRCLRGDSHRAAVLLGIKAGELPESQDAGPHNTAPRRAS